MTALKEDRNFDAALIDAVFVQLSIQSMERARQEFLSSLRSMDALDAAVYRRMAQLGDEFTPFDDAALKHYEELMNQAEPEVTAERPSKSQVQTTLRAALREKSFDSWCALKWQGAGIRLCKDFPAANSWVVSKKYSVLI